MPRRHILIAIISIWGNLGGLVVAYGIFFFLPNFWIGLPILLGVAGAEAGIYLNIRKKKVGLGDLRTQFDNWLASFKGKKKAEEKTTAGEVILVGKNNKPVEPPQANTYQDALRTMPFSWLSPIR